MIFVGELASPKRFGALKTKQMNQVICLWRCPDPIIHSACLFALGRTDKCLAKGSSSAERLGSQAKGSKPVFASGDFLFWALLKDLLRNIFIYFF